MVSPAESDSLLRALRVMSESSPTSVSRGNETVLRDCRILRVIASETLTKLGALIEERVVMFVASRLPSMDLTPLMVAVVRGEARMMSPEKVEQPEMVSSSDWVEAVSVVEQTSVDS